MKARCRRAEKGLGKDANAYRGITFCKDWLNFQSFKRDMGIRPTKNHTIDRIDSTKGYYPTNCRWATSKEQALNRRTSRLFTINGNVDTLRGWSLAYGRDRATVGCRLKRGWSIEEALMTPTKKKKLIK